MENIKNINYSKYIIKSQISNSVGQLNKINLDTADYVYLPSVNDLKLLNSENRMGEATDFALLCGCVQRNTKTKSNIWPVGYLTRNPSPEVDIDRRRHLILSMSRHKDNLEEIMASHGGISGIRPMMKLNVSDLLLKESLTLNDLGITVDKNGVAHILLGEYPSNLVERDLGTKLENAFLEDNAHELLKPTGNMYTVNGSFSIYGYSSRCVPEFEFKGQKYVRVISSTSQASYLSNNMLECDNKKAIWLKVEPISFTIFNWPVISKRKNLGLNDEDICFQLLSDKVILSSIPFDPEQAKGNLSLWQNSLIRAYLNSANLNELEVNNEEPYNENYSFSNRGFLIEALDKEREPVSTYIVPKNEIKIGEYAFDGCKNLQRIVAHGNIQIIDNTAFNHCDFNFVYRTKNSDEIIFAKELPADKELILDFCDLSSFKSVVSDFNYSIFIISKNYNEINSLIDLLKKTGIKLPYEIALELLKNGQIEDFCKNKTMQFFKSECIPYMKRYSNKELTGIFKLAIAIGCFEKCYLLKKDGVMTDGIWGQKASSFLARLLQSDTLYYRDFCEFNANLDYANQQLLQFLMVKNDDDEYVNFSILEEIKVKQLEVYRCIFKDFDKIARRRKYIDELGKTRTRTWQQCIESYAIGQAYPITKEDDRDFAEEFYKLGVDGKTFKMAIATRDDAIKQNMPHHILNTELKETSIVDEIDSLSRKMDIQLAENKQELMRVFYKNFTYEFLDKYDPKNSIMGLLCDCCAVISSCFYGAEITRAVMTQPDVQNLVIKNAKGEIIAKTAIYVNREKGYAVANAIQISQSYKVHECENMGVYDTTDNSTDEIKREKLFNAFLRGIKDFIDQYNKENPNNPIIQFNMGYGTNKLKRQLSAFKEAYTPFEVPVQYGFKDTTDQYIIYKKGKPIKMLKISEVSESEK